MAAARANTSQRMLTQPAPAAAPQAPLSAVSGATRTPYRPSDDDAL